MTARRDGMALMATLLALVILEAAVAGALFLTAMEARTTRTLTARARAELAAESAIAAAIDGWKPDIIAALAPHDTAAIALPAMPPGTTLHARVEHVATGAYIIRALGTVPAPAAQAQATAVALVHWLAPAALSAAAPAALTVGGSAVLHPGAVVDGSLTTASCITADSLARAAFPAAAGIAAQHTGAISIGPAAALTGSPPILVAPVATSSAAFALMGPLDTTQLARAADRVESGALTLAARPASPGSAFACDTTATANWGAPGNPSHPCAEYVPLVHAPADLTVAGGAGQALLLVAGNLTIDSAADFHGFAAVLGNATIHGRVHGALSVRGNTDVHGEIRRDPCALWRAFTRPAALARPHRRLPRWRLPAF